MTVEGATTGHGLPPGPTSPGVAQTLRWMYRPIPFIRSCRRRYGSVFTVGLGPDRNVVVVAEPNAARQVITGDPAVYRAGDANGLLRPVVGNHSILVIDGEEHLRHRRMLLPAFGAEHGRLFAEQVAEIARERVGRWRRDQVLELQSEMEAISFEAIMRVTFGGEDRERGERLRELIPDMMRRCASPFTLLPYFRKELGGVTPYARLQRVLRQIDRLFMDALAARRANPAEGSHDVLSLLAAATDEDGGPLPDEVIRDELLTMIMAGYETTTSGLAWSFERLLRSPRVLERARRGIELGDGYIDAVVQETLRLRPVVPVVARKVSEPVELAGHRIPAGTVLMASVYLLHRDPELWERPDEFLPERFLDAGQKPGAFVPFGGGVRRCLGASFAQLEMEVVLSTVLRAVELAPADPADEPVARRRFTFAPGRGARVRVAGTLQPAA